MVVSELVRGRHLSGAQSQGPALSSSHALGSVRRQAPSSAPTSLRDTEGRSGAEFAPGNQALLKWGEWSGHGSPRYSRWSPLPSSNALLP